MESTVAELAALVGGRIVGNAGKIITGVSALPLAGPGQLSFLSDDRYRPLLGQARAGVILIREPTSDPLDFIVVDDPHSAFTKIASHFHPPEIAQRTSIHPAAVIDPTARLDAPVRVEALAVVGAGVVVGSGTVIHAGVVVGAGSRIGRECILYPRVVLYPGVTLGDRVILHAGCVIGSDGFGFAREDGRYRKFPHLGTVVIEDDVEIGANSTIDRGALGETRIGRGVKIDNLVMIAHNCQIGEDSAIAAQVGVSGSTKIGKRVSIGGQAGIAGHIFIVDDVVVGAQSGVIGTIDEAGTFVGYPALKGSTWFRLIAELTRLKDLRKTLETLAEKAPPPEDRVPPA